MTPLEAKRLIKARGESAMINTPLFDEQPSGDLDRYVVLTMSSGTRPMIRESGERGREFPFYAMAVGRTADDCLAAVEQCDRAWLDYDLAPGQPGVSRITRDDVVAPMIPYGSVEGDERNSITLMYRLVSDG